MCVSVSLPDSWLDCVGVKAAGQRNTGLSCMRSSITTPSFVCPGWTERILRESMTQQVGVFVRTPCMHACVYGRPKVVMSNFLSFQCGGERVKRRVQRHVLTSVSSHKVWTSSAQSTVIKVRPPRSVDHLANRLRCAFTSLHYAEAISGVQSISKLLVICCRLAIMFCLFGSQKVAYGTHGSIFHPLPVCSMWI